MNSRKVYVINQMQGFRAYVDAEGIHSVWLD